jgi:acyl-CoA synthetase (AMP-forming)/AMP-acid ligase II
MRVMHRTADDPNRDDPAGPVRGLWREPLRAAFARAPGPSVRLGDAVAQGAVLWAGAEAWRAALHAAGARRGDRVVCALPPGAGFASLAVAALWDDLTFVPVPPAADVGAALEELDARLAVIAAGYAAARHPTAGAVVAGGAGEGPAGRIVLRPARGPATPAARFILQTSGTGGAPRRVALSDANVWAVLAGHRPPLGLGAEAVALSVLPWHHVFGLVLELLPAVLGGAELARDPAGGRDPTSMLALAAARPGASPVTHLHAVPHTVRLLAARDDGRALLRSLRGGLVGGAPADAALAEALAGTRVRVGYGQTEASPGICLGAAGAWRAGTLGAPLGCEVRLDGDGVLAFRGPNAHLGLWADRALETSAPDRWVRTGDLARREDDGTYTFEGRQADSFKLGNGRYVAALAVERAACARWPQLAEALLSSPDGDALRLAASTRRDGDPLPDAAELRAGLADVLGPLARRPLAVVRVAPGAWARTPKGELDRRFPTGRGDAGAPAGVEADSGR